MTAPSDPFATQAAIEAALTSTQHLAERLAGGGPHEWGYRDLADGTFIADGTPFEMAERLETLRQAIPALLAAYSALTADRDRLSASRAAGGGEGHG